MIRPILAAAILAAGVASFSGAADAQNFNGTCPRVWRQGPMLYAQCLNAYGMLVTSSINAYSCPPANINNANGNLVCTAGGGGGGGGYGGGYGGGGGYGDGYGPRPRRYGY